MISSGPGEIGSTPRHGIVYPYDSSSNGPRRRPYPSTPSAVRRSPGREDRTPAAGTGAELVVELELAARHVEEAAEVDVVGAGLERAAHDVEVEAVVDGVHDHPGALEPVSKRVGVGDVDVLVALEPEVQSPHRSSPGLEKAGHGPADRPGRAEHRDHGAAAPRRAARASCALSASHSSIRCSGSSGWRPVASRSRSIR